MKKDIILYIISIIFFILGVTIDIGGYQFIFYFISVFLVGYDLIIEGIKNIFKLNFEEDTLMTIAVIAAFILGEYPESCLVLLLYKLGEFLEDYAVDKSNNNIEEITKIKSNTANLLIDNKIEVVEVEKLKVGDKILIKAGEKVPVDCKIYKGTTKIDASPITGESKKIDKEENMELLSGSLNLTGGIYCEVTKEYKDSTATKIVDLVYEATNNKGKTEKFITKFSKIYTPIVIVIAILITVIPAIMGLNIKAWVMKSLFFLVASCPCSIIISIPLAFLSCIGAISKKGMIIKGTKHIENLSKSKAIAFDKTGTLTTGEVTIEKIETFNKFDKNIMLQYIFNLEELSNHPISKVIKEIGIKPEKLEVKDYKEIAGHGIYAKINDEEVIFGNKKLLDKYKVNTDNYVEDSITLSINKKIIGYITLKEKSREEAKDLIKRLSEIGINRVVMLTGDNKKSANKIAEELKISEVYSELLPEQKLEKVNEIKKENKVIFVGDGINDSPVIATADFGISMGEGTEIANNTSDAILLSNNLATIPDIINIARESMKIVKFNIAFSIIVKFIVLILGFIGIAPMWSAVLADTGVSLITVLNSVRIFKK